MINYDDIHNKLRRIEAAQTKTFLALLDHIANAGHQCCRLILEENYTIEEKDWPNDYLER